MINVVIYTVVAACGLVLAVLNLNVASLVSGLCMAGIGAVGAVQQYRRVKSKGTQGPKTVKIAIRPPAFLR